MTTLLPLLIPFCSTLLWGPPCPSQQDRAASERTRAPAEAPVFALRRGPEGFSLERLLVQEGAPLELPCGTEEGWLELILPVGPGGSASIIQGGGGGLARAVLEDGKLQVTHVGEDGGTWQGPALSLEDLRGLRVRVSLTAADGSGTSFVITDWDEARKDEVGPAVNPFDGKIPLAEGDFSLFTDTLRLRTGPPTSGSCPLEHDRYLFVKGRIPGGGEGWFLLDTGGAITAVTSLILPPGHSVNKAQAVQYTSSGREFLKYSPEGATGAIDTVEGTAELSHLVFGDLRFEDARVTVLSELPDLFGRPVVGILGLDLLRRAPRCRLELGKEDGRLALFGEMEPEAPPAAELPFTYVRDHLMVAARVNQARISMVLDTGSPALFLDETAALAAGLGATDGESRSARGIDSGGATAIRTSSDTQTIHLGDCPVEVSNTVFGPLPVFSSLHGGGQLVGLLGNSVLSTFSALELDFSSERILLLR